MSVKILIDSSSDISAKEAKEMGISMIPMPISFGDEQFYDGVDLLPDEFYKKITTQKIMPKTSQITSYRFEEAFKELTADGSEVVAIVLSSKLSGTYEGAMQAKEKFNGKVFVIDSLSAATGERLLCQYALDLITKGLSAKEVCDELERVKPNLCIFAVLDTLEYLKRGGRISGMVAFVGGLLNIKPIVTLQDGAVKMVDKARGANKGLEMLNSIVADNGGIDFSMPMGVLWTGNDGSKAKKYVKDNADLFQNKKDVGCYVLGSTIGTHVGPGVVGLAYFKKQ